MCSPGNPLFDAVNQATGGAPMPPGTDAFFRGPRGTYPRPNDPNLQRYLPSASEVHPLNDPRTQYDAINGMVNNDSALAAVFGKAMR